MNISLPTQRVRQQAFIQETCNLLLVCYLSFIFYWYLFKYQFSFNYEVEKINQYEALFYCTSFALFFLLLRIAMIMKRKLTPNFLASSVLIITVNLCFAFSDFYTISNEYLVNVQIVIYTFLLCDLNKKYLKTIPYLLFSFFWFELLLGLQQIFLTEDFVPAKNFTGGFNNSGIYSMFMTLSLPFILYVNKLFTISNPLVDRLLKVSPIVFVTLLDVAVASRTATGSLALLAFIHVIPMIRHKISFYLTRKTKILVLSIALSLVCLIFFLVVNIKYNSAIGRLMKWNIAVEHIYDNFWFGTGVGRFTWYYPQWQALHFQDEANKIYPYSLVADESYLLFNEILQLFQTVGFFGFVIIVFIVNKFFNSHNGKCRDLFTASKLTVIMILVCSLGSYPLHVNAILVIFSSCFAIVFSLYDNRDNLFVFHNRFLKISLFLLLSSTTAFAIHRSYKQNLAAENWRILRSKAFTAESYEHTKAICSLLKHDGKFLTDYGSYIIKNMPDNKMALQNLRLADTYFISVNTIESLGNAYFSQKNYNAAAKCYSWLTFYIPAKFRFKFELLQCFSITNREAAINLSDQILSMPVKIPSIEVDLIKIQTSAIADSLKRASPYSRVTCW